MQLSFRHFLPLFVALFVSAASIAQPTLATGPIQPEDQHRDLAENVEAGKLIE